jgi:hypothetical protein
MRLRSHVERLKRIREGGSGGFRLANGRWYSYDFEQAAGALFVHCVGCMGQAKLPSPDDPEPEEPEILKMIREAEDPHRAMAPFRPENEERGFADPAMLLAPGSLPLELPSEAHPDSQAPLEEIPDLSE